MVDNMKGLYIDPESQTIQEIVIDQENNTSVLSIKETTKLILNGHDRFAAQTREYFQLRQPLEYHTAVPGYNVKEVEHPKFGAPIIKREAFNFLKGLFIFERMK